MSKIFGSIFLFLFLCFSVSAEEDIKIISRSEWGANEEYRYLDSSEWKEIIESWSNTPKKELTPEEQAAALKKAERTRAANDFLVNDFQEIFEIASVDRFENVRKLAWPVAKSKRKTAIVIHHTDGEYEDSYDAIRKIYKFHALGRQWGDIGYNYLIGLDGEIFEGRAGGDFVVGAHDKWNNQGTIGISVIGDYHSKPVSDKQYESLEKLVRYVAKKYDIDFQKKQPFFKWCVKEEDCSDTPLEVNYHYPIIGHRDAGHTSCPGDALYAQIQDLKANLIEEALGEGISSLERIEEIISRVSEEKLLPFLALIEKKLDTTRNPNTAQTLNFVKSAILKGEKKRNINFDDPPDQSDIEFSSGSFDENNTIRVKLSYPQDETIEVFLKGEYEPKITKKGEEYILSFEECKNDQCKQKKSFRMNFAFSGSDLFLNARRVNGFGIKNFFRIRGPDDNILTLTSWDRFHAWDTKNQYNDNKFRGDIILYQKPRASGNIHDLIVVNELLLNDYLKGLGEVSNSTHKEKIRAIIILARTYARWYITKAEKFVGEWYHASDDPNVFQRYLGYGLEQRSPNVNAIVEETKDVIITHEGELIKPWYFSRSDGKTKDFIEFCKTAKGVPDCQHPEKFPFLIGVLDPGGEGQERWGHGIGVPGTGLDYFAQRGWIAQMMIKYFLKGVEINTL